MPLSPYSFGTLCTRWHEVAVTNFFGDSALIFLSPSTKCFQKNNMIIIKCLRKRWTFIDRGKCDAQTEGVACRGLPIQLPKGNKFPRTIHFLKYYMFLPIYLLKMFFLFMRKILFMRIEMRMDYHGNPFA